MIVAARPQPHIQRAFVLAGGYGMNSDTEYWFAAKRYGWGWGLPTVWQGWVVLAAFIGLVAAGAFIFPPHQSTAAFVGYIVVLCAVLTGICWLKGEPSRWRWGNDDR
jgi:hypothetical protein